MPKSTGAVKRTKVKMNAAYKNILISTVLPLFVHIAITAALCLMMFTTDMNIYDNYFLVVLSIGAACFISAYIVGRRVKKNGMIIGIIYNILPVTAYICTSLSLNSFKFDLRLAVLLAVYLTLSSVGGITAVNSRPKKIIKKR